MWTLESQPCSHVEFVKELASNLTNFFSSSIIFALSKILFNNDLEPTLLTLHTACDLPATLYTLKWDRSGMDSCNPRFSGLENRFVVFFSCPFSHLKGSLYFWQTSLMSFARDSKLSLSRKRSLSMMSKYLYSISSTRRNCSVKWFTWEAESLLFFEKLIIQVRPNMITVRRTANKINPRPSISRRLSSNLRSKLENQRG